jgi:cell division septation protein DedD
MAYAAEAFDSDPTVRQGWRRQVRLALGAAAALALIWAAASWIWGLSARDPGEIPFLKAGGAWKVAPEDPGGLDLDAADRAVERMLGDAGPARTALAPPDEMPAREDLPAPLLDEAAPPEPEADPIEAAVARVLSEQADRPAADDAPEAPQADGRAPAASPPAPARPRDIAALRARQAAAPAPEAPSLASGDQAVQLGAFDSQAIAESEWRRHLSRNGDLLDGFAHAVTTVQSGGRTLWRLRVGPLPDRRRAQELCAALQARGDACIPARVR